MRIEDEGLISGEIAKGGSSSYHVIQVDNAIEYFREETSSRAPSEDWMYVYRGLVHESLYESSAREFERDLAERDYCRAVCAVANAVERQQTSCGPVRTKRGIAATAKKSTVVKRISASPCCRDQSMPKPS